MKEVKIHDNGFDKTKVQIDEVFSYYLKHWEPHADKLIDFYSKNTEIASIIFARGICEGINICNSKLALENNLKVIKGETK